MASSLPPPLAPPPPLPHGRRQLRLRLRPVPWLLALAAWAPAAGGAAAASASSAGSAAAGAGPVADGGARGGDGLLRRVADPKSYEAFIYEPPGARGGDPASGKATRSPWPLLLFLHGRPESGQGGKELERIISWRAAGPMWNLSRGIGIPEFTERFVVAAPQARGRGKDHGFKTDAVLRFVDFLLRPEASGLHLDPARLYVTGSSMGGWGALLAAASGRFAAVVPVAAAGKSLHAGPYRRVPVWGFHARNDVVINYTFTEKLLHDLWAMGVPEATARLTLYDWAPPPPGSPEHYGHGCGIPAYRTPELFDWLLTQRLAAAGRNEL